MTQAHFRYLLIASLVIGLASGLVDWVFSGLIPEGLHAAQEAQDQLVSDTELFWSAALAFAALLLHFVSAFGLYQFRPWAPRVGLICTALTLLLFPLVGATVQSGLAMSLGYVSSYLWGAVIVMAYAAPYKAWFARRARALDVPRED
jgi:hypothetical protein